MAGACYQDAKYFVTELATLESIAQLSGTIFGWRVALGSSNQISCAPKSNARRDTVVADIIINVIEGDRLYDVNGSMYKGV